MTVRRLPPIVFFVTGLALACGGEPTAPLDDGGGGLRTPLTGIRAEELAAAMQSPEVAGLIFRALQSSPYSEHKIVLQDLVGSSDALPLLEAIALDRGSTVPAVKAGLLGTPSLDLYIPDGTHRERWTGREKVVVADAREHHNGVLSISSAAGAMGTIDSRQVTAPEVLLLIQPSEPKAYRIGLYSEQAGPGVQAVGERQIGVMVVRAGDDGLPDTIQLAELAREGRDPGLQLAKACPDDHPEWCEGSGGGGGGTGQNDPVWQTIGTTYLVRVGAAGVCDVDLCDYGNDNEFEFFARWEYGSVVEQNMIRITGVRADDDIGGLHLWLLNRKPTLDALITVRLIETDVVENDDFGTVYLGPSELNTNVFWWQNLAEVEPYAYARFTW